MLRLLNAVMQKCWTGDTAADAYSGGSLTTEKMKITARKYLLSPSKTANVS